MSSHECECSQKTQTNKLYSTEIDQIFFLCFFFLRNLYKIISLYFHVSLSFFFFFFLMKELPSSLTDKI